MDVFKEILKALKKRSGPILKFQNYKMIKELGQGEQGLVLQITNNIGKQLALKFYRQTDEDARTIKEGINNFIREIKILSSLYHKNIANIFTGGTALWNQESKKWLVKESLKKEEKQSDNNLVYFYIMDYIDKDISTIFKGLETKKTIKKKEMSIYQQVEQFEEMIKQILNAMKYYHCKKITHKDIKPDNIRYNSVDSTFIVGDFGFARHLTSPQDDGTRVRIDFFDSESIKRKDYIKTDLAQFSQILLKILPSFISIYDNNRYKGLTSSIEKAINQRYSDRYNCAEEFYNNVRQYFLKPTFRDFKVELGETMTSDYFGRFDTKVRIPVSGSIYLTKEIRQIIDTKQFQRLRGVRQLGPTMFIFPGANHTRFEHSLGTYHLSMKYIEKLINFPIFKTLCEPLDDTIKLIVLSSLLHDIGHYPYSHWIEEIREYPRNFKFQSHEERAKEILSSGQIYSIITNEWGIDPEIISNIISNQVNEEDRSSVLVNSIINSIIDVDKLDYLVRDSIHCGVDYGKGIDIERLFDSLYINPKTNKICLTSKGRSLLLSILTCRNIMYQEVYWHKTVRAADAMFKRFFYEYLNKKNITQDKVNTYFQMSDDEFISQLYKDTKKDPEMKKLISPFVFKGRSIYKPAFIFFKGSTSREGAKTKTFFKTVLSSNYPNIVRLSEALAEKLKKFLPGITSHDIIIEKTPLKLEHEFYGLDGFEIWNTRKDQFEYCPKEVGILNDYLNNNTQAYIFCHNKYYKKLIELTKKEDFNKILGEIK